MSTKTITVTNPKDFQEGDLFTGVAIQQPQPGIITRTEVAAQPITSANHAGRFYLKDFLRTPYLDTVDTSLGETGYWEEGYVTREVEEPDLPSKQGIWLYYSYGLDEDGDLSHFPNLILHLENSPERGWYNVGNSSASGYPMKPEEVRAALPRMAALTLKEDKK